jgi:hypothetical protein
MIRIPGRVRDACPFAEMSPARGRAHRSGGSGSARADQPARAVSRSAASAEAGACTHRVLGGSAQTDHSRASSQKRPSNGGQDRGDPRRARRRRYAPTVPSHDAPGDQGDLPASTPGATARDVADGTRRVIISTCYPPRAGTILGRYSAMMTCCGVTTLLQRANAPWGSEHRSTKRCRRRR